MAPKRRGSVYGGPVATRKRTVRRPARQPSPESLSTSSSSTPSANPVPSSPSSQPIDTLAGRIITMGRKVNFGFFDDEGFSIGRLLKEAGLEKVCSLDLPTYPALVKEFYQELSRGDGGIVSSVRGKRIHLTSEILENLLEIPTLGNIVSSHNNRSGALSRMLGREVAEFEEVRANQLPLELRLLHNICSRILFPKTGRFEYVSERDVVIMDSILTGHPINLPGMMIWYIAEAGGKKRSSLPYGMILTLAFKNQGVVIMDNEPKKHLRHTDYYSLATVHRMGFVKVNGVWERKSQNEDRPVDLGAPAPSEAGPSIRHDFPESIRPSSSLPSQPAADATATASASCFSDIQLEQLKSLLTAQREELKNDFESSLMNLRELFYALDDRLKKVESTVGTSAESLSKDLKNIFEELKDICGDGEIYSKCNAELQDKITTACAFLDRRLKEFVLTQSKGMEKIIEELQRIIRTNFSF